MKKGKDLTGIAKIRLDPNLGQIKIKCVSGNMSENFRYCWHTCFFYYFSSGRKYNFVPFERNFACKPKKNSRFHQ